MPGVRLAAMMAIFAIIVAPMLANMLPDLQSEGDFFTAGGGFTDIFSADVAGYLVPTMQHPIFGQLAAHMPFPHDKGQHIYLGYAVMALAVLGAATRPRRTTAFWAASALIFWLLTLGPTLRVMGHDTSVPGPFALIGELPFFKGNRYPSRYAVMLILSVAVLAAAGMATLQRWLPAHRQRLLLGALFFFFMVENISAPLPLSDMRIPAIYRQIATDVDATPGIVLELPLGWRNGARVAGKKDVIIMFEQWYQTAHHRPILGGNTSRNPEFKFQYFSEAPLLDLLIAMTNAADEPLHQALRDELAPLYADLAAIDQAPPAWLAERRQQAAQVLSFLNVAYVVVHRTRVPAELEQYVTGVFPVRFVQQEGDLALYRIDLTLARQYDQNLAAPEIAMASGLGHLARGEGWSLPSRLQTTNVGRATSLDASDASALLTSAVWAQRKIVRLQVPISPATRGIDLLARAPGPGQEVTLIADGHVVGRQPVTEGWTWLRFPWQPGPVSGGLVSLQLEFARTFDPAVVLSDPSLPISSPSIGASLAVDSAGEEVGNFAHIYVNGVDWSFNQRGYNLVEIDPGTGRVARAAAFDTFASEAESQAMARWLRETAPNRWVLGAVKDEASLNLTADAVAALNEIGITTDLRGHFRWSHAFIGAGGGKPGEAIESLAAVRPATAVIGPGLTEPRVAAAIAALRVIATDH
jgi:hypothetical protein